MTNIIKVTVDEKVIFERGRCDAECDADSRKQGQANKIPGIVWYLESKNKESKEPGILENTGSCFID